MNDQSIVEQLSRNADQCVKCGLCLPHCPTYRVQQDEAESPRGRIALIQGLAEDNLKESPRFAAHLSSCLECRACEVACPSLVKFGSLMDDVRALRVHRLSPWARSMKWAWLQSLSSNWGTSAAAWASKIYRSVGLGHLVDWMAPPPGSRLRAYHRVALQLDRPREARATAPGNEEVESDLALFVGCVAQAAQPGLATAVRRVLGRLGYPLQVPGNQRCCGAMHRHGGFPDDADELAAHNASVFADHRILSTASACAAELSAQQDLDRIEEICRFLTGLDWPQDAQLRPLPDRVAVHEPCSHRNILRDGNAAYDLLRRIPDIEVVALEDNAFCCGAAGTYLLENPTLSATLLAPKIEHLKGLNTKILVTTNTGCSLHLAAGAREAGLELEVLHPVELIERQLMETAAE